MESSNNKKYSILYCDPPWDYQFGKTSHRRVSNHYPVMNLQDICNLKVRDICEKDSVLLMWVTFPKLEECFQVIKAWGFTYKTVIFTWVKRNKKTDSFFWGMGNYTRSNAEVCLLATRGKPLPRYSKSIHSVIYSPIRDHSEKPYEARQNIELLFGLSVNKIELFARHKYDGWDAWGKDIKSNIIL